MGQDLWSFDVMTDGRHSVGLPESPVHLGNDMALPSPSLSYCLRKGGVTPFDRAQRVSVNGQSAGS